MALSASVWNTNWWILHGLSVRSFGIFNPRDHFWDPGFQIWSPAGLEIFFGKEVAWTHDFAEGMLPLLVCGGFVQGVAPTATQEALGQAHFPQTLPEKHSVRFPNFLKIRGPFSQPRWVPYRLCIGAIAYFTTSSPACGQEEVEILL